MPLVSSDIRRVDIEEGVFGVPASYDAQRVAALNLYPAQPFCILLRERLPLVVQLPAHSASSVIAEAAIELAAVGAVREHPDRPCPFHTVEHIRIRVDDLSPAVHISAMERKADFMLQRREAVPYDLVEVYKLPVGVVYDLDLRRILGEKHSSAAEERLAVDSVLRNKTDNN